MSNTRGQAVIGADMFIKGDIRNGKHIDVLGLVEGSISAERVVVHNGGRVTGTLIADNALVDGVVQGHVLVRQLIEIGSTGAVHGDVRYGKIAMQIGAELTADVRNVPPEIAGDLNLAVKRGQNARITTEDLTAIDPDSPVTSLVFAVSKATNGFVARTTAATTPIESFTQADLYSNKVMFVHDGSVGATASFDVVVTDNAGDTSGTAKTVHVAVFK
jgi:cytoskeletal protein CcmA (bactofilin family)